MCENGEGRKEFFPERRFADDDCADFRRGRRGGVSNRPFNLRQGGGGSKLSENEVPIYCISLVLVQSAHVSCNALPLSREKLSDVNVA